MYKAECMSIYCSMSCKIEMEINERCGLGNTEDPPKACFPSACGKAPAWRIKKIVSQMKFGVKIVNYKFKLIRLEDLILQLMATHGQ